MPKSTVILKFANFLASGFGIGHSPIAPGTCGSLLWLGIWLALSKLCLGLRLAENLWLLLTLVTLAIWSIHYCLNQTNSAPGDNDKNQDKEHRDPKYIVIDEWIGMQIALLPVSFVDLGDLIGILVAFTLFRFFDIIKPGPVHWVEDLPGAWGVILDDCVAGLISAIIFYIGNLLLIWWLLGK